MASVLVLNVGSSSLKAALFAEQQRIWQGTTALEGSSPAEAAASCPALLERWLKPQLEPWWDRLTAAGHRLVHGGEHGVAPAQIDATVLRQLEQRAPLAPLHTPPALAVIRWLSQQQPDLPQWACFDTAFHASLEPPAYSYALPEAWRAQGYRRLGFHGLNHQHVAETAAHHWRDAGHRGQPRLISAHLGAGCSLAAIRDGRSIDTSMGFTPLEGLVMAQRSGSVDPGVLLQLQRQGLSADAIEAGLSQAGGLLGLSGLSGDWQTLRTAEAEGHPGAALALAVFRHRLLAGIGAMAAVLGGVDAIALSGGIGAHDGMLLSALQQQLAWLGPMLWLQVPADEEGMIARLLQRALASRL